MSVSPKTKILLLVGGSIAAYKAVALTSLLVRTGMQVKVVFSPSAHHFIGKASFEGLTRDPVYEGTFEPGRMMAHIELERWADLILLYPASASLLSSLARGAGEDLISTLFLAHEFKKPFFVIPSMNQAMWLHPATQKNVKILREFGVQVFDPATGPLACGESGPGRAMEPESILAILKDTLETRTERNPLTILITGGGTSERIDAVRSIRNTSTGRTSHALSLFLQDRGHHVTLLQAEDSPHQGGIQDLKVYRSTQDLSNAMEALLAARSFDVLIHAAAVADYHVKAISSPSGRQFDHHSKIQESGPLFIELEPNPKILKQVRRWSRNPELKVVSFKLTVNADSDLKLDHYDSDWLVHNLVSEVSASSHQGRIFTQTQDGAYHETHQFNDRGALAHILTELIESSGNKQREVDHGSFA